MKIVKVERAGVSAEGFLEEDRVHIVGGWCDLPADAAAFTLSTHTAADLDSLRKAVTETVDLTSVTLAVPIDPSAKILCVGKNYRDHVGEIGAEIAEDPTIFIRSQDSIVPHNASIVRPKVSEMFDFEGEVAIVIGRAARHVTVDAAMDHVAGYTCFMDGSIRDYQKHSLTAGKNFWRSGAMGPWIVPAAALDVEDPMLVTRLNGAAVQSARASQMIFGIPQIIAYCSRWTMLKPGDVIAMGTPGGVGARRTPPLWMKPGDRLEVEIEGVGMLTNTVIDEN